LALAWRLIEFTLQFTTGLVQAEQFVDVEVDALDPDRHSRGVWVSLMNRLSTVVRCQSSVRFRLQAHFPARKRYQESHVTC